MRKGLNAEEVLVEIVQDNRLVFNVRQSLIVPLYHHYDNY